MDAYTICTILGAGGLGLMALGGAGHGHGAHAHAGHLHAGHGHAASGSPVKGGAPHGHATAGAHAAHGAPAHAHAAPASRASAARGVLLGLLEPRMLFSVLLGVGIGGLLLRTWMSGPALAAAAVGAGIALELVLFGPVWRFLFRFASEPALTLETTIGDEVTAATAFDADGCGLVRLELDGRVAQVLGVLRPGDRGGPRVRAGERLVVDEVDPATNRCILRRLGA